MTTAQDVSATTVVNTAYGRPALDALRDVVAQAKRNDLMAPVTILVPNNIAGIVARRHLARGITEEHPGIAGIYVSTLPRLAEQLAAGNLAPRRPATRPIVASAWRSALHDQPGVFDRVKDHPATIRALSRAHQELRQLSAAMLDVVAAASTVSADLVRLHRTVLARLAPGWYDAVDLLDMASSRLKPKTVAEIGAVVLYLPQDLSRAELRFASALSQLAPLTVVAGQTGAPRADTVVADTLNGLTASAEGPSQTPPTATQILHASDSDEEVRAVVRRVVVDLQTTPAHRIAVLYAATSPYARLLHEQFRTAGITINGPGVRSVHERALAQGILGILALAADDVPRGDLFRALAAAPTRQFLQDYVPVSRWERVSRLAGVVGGDHWSKRLSYFHDQQRALVDAEPLKPDPVVGRLDALIRHLMSAQELMHFTATLRDRFADAATRTSWMSLSDWARELFHDLYGSSESMTKLPAEEQYAAAAIEQSLSGLSVLQEFEPDSASLAALTEILASELESSLPRVGRFGEGVFVGPVSNAVGLDLDSVYIVGLAEDGYPGRLGQDSLLPESIRELTGGELASERTTVDAKHRHLLAAFASAPEVVACFPRGDLRRSTRRIPSRWLLPTLTVLGNAPDLAATGWESVSSDRLISCASYAAELDRSTQLATEQDWRVRATRSGLSPEDPIVASATEMTRARGGAAFTRYDGNLAGQPGLPDFAHTDTPVSPTQLEAYATCPHAYFMHRLLRIEPLEHPEEIITVSAMEIGLLIHDSMDQLVHEFHDSLPSYGERWTDDQRVRLLEIAAKKGIEQERRGATGHPTLWKRERERLQIDLLAMLGDDDTWRAGRGARVVQSELAFGMKDQPPVVVEVPGGRVLMRGSADKVDQTRSGKLLVTDIKTGGPSSYRVIEEDPLAAGTKLQLPVYAYAAQQRLGGSEVEAHYWFVRKEAGRRVPVVLDEPLRQTYATTLGTLVSSIAAGQFPAKAPAGADFGWVRCWYCNPDGLGHGEVREQWERKSRAGSLRGLVALIDPDALDPGKDLT